MRSSASRLGVFAALFLAMLSPVRAEETGLRTLSTGQVLRGHFVQDRQLSGFAKSLRSEGSFVLVPGTGLIWSAQKPFANTTVVTPDGILQLSNGQEEMRLPASRLPGLSHLYEALGAAVSGDIKPLRQAFAVAQSASPGQWRIVLTPLKPDSPAFAALKSLTLTGSHFVDSVEIDKGGGDVDHTVFLDQSVASADLTPDEKALLGALHK